MIKISDKTFVKLKVGDSAGFNFKFTQKAVSDFAVLSGDNNPLHIDHIYAGKTKFKQPIVHGMLSGALFSRLIGMYLPGKYSLYISQSLFFHKPILIGADVVVKGEIIQKVEIFNLVKISTKVCDEKTGQVLVSGEASVKLLK